MAAIGRDINHHLQLRMIQQPAIARAIMALGKLGLKTFDIEAADTGLALVDAAQEPNFAIVGKQIDDFVILRFVDEIAIAVLDPADLVDVLLNGKFMFQPVQPGFQRCNIGPLSLLLMA